MDTLSVKKSKSGKLEESLHIKRLKTGSQIDAVLYRVKYRDRDTRQIVVYIPTLDITGYGSTDANAEEMLRYSLDNYFDFLISLTPKKMAQELSDKGWKHNKLRNKDYSRAYVDMDGKLKEFNAVADKVDIELIEF